MMLINVIAKELGFAPDKIKNVVELLEGGATVPFISRYRKEATGSMDEVAVGNSRICTRNSRPLCNVRKQ